MVNYGIAKNYSEAHLKRIEIINNNKHKNVVFDKLLESKLFSVYDSSTNSDVWQNTYFAKYQNLKSLYVR